MERDRGNNAPSLLLNLVLFLLLFFRLAVRPGTLILKGGARSGKIKYFVLLPGLETRCFGV